MSLRVCVSGQTLNAAGSTQEISSHHTHAPTQIEAPPESRVSDLAAALTAGFAQTAEYSETAQSVPFPLTLRVQEITGSQWIAHPHARVTESGIRDGTCVEPVPANPTLFCDPWAVPPRALVSVLSGVRSGSQHLMFSDRCTIGRDTLNTVCLPDASVSRAHASLTLGEDGLWFQDEHSANGSFVCGPSVRTPVNASTRIFSPTTITCGDVALLISPCAQVRAYSPSDQEASEFQQNSSEAVREPHRASHIPDADSPRLVRLPRAPTLPAPVRLPLIAAVSPALMGGALFMVTHSLMSLIGIAMSPVLLLISWAEHRWSQTRAQKRARQVYRAGLQRVLQQVTLLQQSESDRLHSQLPVLPDHQSPNGTLASELRQYSLTRSEPVRVRVGTARLPLHIALQPSEQRESEPDEDCPLLSDIRSCAKHIPDGPVGVALGGGAITLLGTAADAFPVLRHILISAFVFGGASRIRIRILTANDPTPWSWLAWISDAGATPRPVVASTAQEISHVLEEVHSLASCTERETSGKVPHNATHLVLVVDDIALSNDPRITAIESLDAQSRITIIRMLRHPSTAGQSPGVTLSLGDTHCELQRVETSGLLTRIVLNSVDSLSRLAAERWCREIAQFTETHAATGQVLPQSLRLTELYPHRLALGTGNTTADSAHRYISAWFPSGIPKSSAPGQVYHPSPFRAAVLGVGAHGVIPIDLTREGPHALIIGTTGSGKSALLQTWLLALAAEHPPESLALFLIDFKGGAAFLPLAKLPHVVGVVTDLTEALAERAIHTLRAELRKRECLLARHEAASIDALHRVAPAETPPRLVVCIDEFAVLAEAHSTFVSCLTDVAQRGRSLGIHLVLSSQRATGALSGSLRSNINIRIVLRVTESSESTDLLGIPDAAYLPTKTPGRAYLRVHTESPRLLQSAWGGGAFTPTQHGVIRVTPLNAVGLQQQLPSRSGEHPTPVGSEAHEIAAVCAALTLAAHQVREHGAPKPQYQVWCPPLPLRCTFSDLEALPASAVAGGSRPLIGIQDLPHRQQQQRFALAFDQHHTALCIGSARSGTTTTLNTIVSAFLRTHPAAWIYAIDAKNGALQSLSQLDQCGAVVPHTEREWLERLVAFCGKEFHRRRQSAHQHAVLRDPPILLVIDGLSALKSSCDRERSGSSIWDPLEQILEHGHHCNMFIICSTPHLRGLPSGITALFTEVLIHRVDHSKDIAQWPETPRFIGSFPPGRVFHPTSATEVQVALPPATHQANTDRTTQPESLPQRLSAPITSARTPPVLPAPRLLTAQELPRVSGKNAFALELRTWAPLPAPPSGLVLVTGPAGSGRTTTLHTLQLAAQHRDSSTVVVCSQPDGHCGACQTGVSQQSSRCFTTIAEAQRFWSAHAPNHRFTLVIHHERTLSTEAASITSMLHEHGDRLLVLTQCPQDLPHGNWEVSSLVRSAGATIVLQPDPGSVPAWVGQKFTEASCDAAPPGRAYFVREGVLSLVHIALPAQNRFPT